MSEERPEVLKVTLTRSALERMIGGDKQMEVEVRQQIVENFAKSRLKALLNDNAFSIWLNAQAAATTAEVKRLVGEGMQDPLTRHWRIKLATDSEVVVKQWMKENLDKYYKQVLEEKLKEYELVIEQRVYAHKNSLVTSLQKERDGILKEIKTLEAKLEATIDAKMNAVFERRVQAEVQRRLDVAAQIGKSNAQLETEITKS